MRILVFISILICCLSCQGNTGNIEDFKTGSFKTVLDDSDISSTAIRNDSLQIETYNNKRDTFAITWKSNFEYELNKVNPKTELDSTPFYVKITSFNEEGYTFKAYYKGSNFKQKGKAIKLKD